MEENEKKGRTDSNQPTRNTSENTDISGEQTVKRTVSGQRTARRRSLLEQTGEKRVSDGPSVRRRPSGRTQTAARHKRPDGTGTMIERKRPEDTQTAAENAGMEEAGTSPEHRRPQRSRISADRRRPGKTGHLADKRRPAGGEASVRSRQRRPSNRGRQARRKQNRRRRKRNLILKMILFVILLIAAVAGAFLWKKYSPSKEKADLKEYYGIEKEGQLAITINNEITEPHGMISEGKAYVQYETVRDYISNRFYWDPNENILLYTLPTSTDTISLGSV